MGKYMSVSVGKSATSSRATQISNYKRAESDGAFCKFAIISSAGAKFDLGKTILKRYALQRSSKTVTELRKSLCKSC